MRNLLKCIGLYPVEHSDRVPEGKSSHTLLLSGIFRGGIDVLCRIKMALDPVDQTVTINLTVRLIMQIILFFLFF